MDEARQGEPAAARQVLDLDASDGRQLQDGENRMQLFDAVQAFLD
jgi:hypothetical protein